MLAIIRIRGTVKAKQDAVDTLKLLRLNKKMHCVLLPTNNDSYNGMLQKSRDYVTWGEISDDVLLKLLEKRGRKVGDIRLNDKEVASIVAELKSKGKVPEGVKPVFRLNPPSKGFDNGIKHHFPDGELGYRGEKINELLLRMI